MAYEAVVRLHFKAVEMRRDWVPSPSLLKEIFISCAVSFKLPYEVRVLMPGRYGSPLTAYVMLRAGPSHGQLISQAGCPARQLAMRAAEYMHRNGLALPLFSPMLEAACFALNVRPCQGGLGPTASRSWLWYTRPPSMSTLLAVPGSMVRT